MKRIIPLTIIMSFIVTLAQAQVTASDYYLPLCVGNNTTLFCEDGPGGVGHWGSRTTTYDIVKTDLINGELYYLEKGAELMTWDNKYNIFRFFWVKKDSNGNIVMGAYDTDGSGDVNKAVMINPPFLIFPNEFLNVGYSRTFNEESNVTSTEEVISTTETVGQYTNCLQIRDTRKTDGIVDKIQDAYYAYKVGRVKEIGIYPEKRIHTDNLVSVMAEDCSLSILENQMENHSFSLIPNPTGDLFSVNFNQTTLKYKIEVYNSLGQKVFETTTKTQINLESNPKGIYLVKVFDGKDVFTERLLLK